MAKVNRKNQTFLEWEGKVNRAMIHKYDIGIDDIPDMPWYEWFEFDVTVDKAVEKAIKRVNEDGFKK